MAAVAAGAVAGPLPNMAALQALTGAMDKLEALFRWKEQDRFVISQECLLFSCCLKGCFLCIRYQHKQAGVICKRSGYWIGYYCRRWGRIYRILESGSVSLCQNM